jgi:hypothetical protein
MLVCDECDEPHEMIMIETVDGPRPMPIIRQIGLFAIHPCSGHDDDDPCWHVTHIPTGLCAACVETVAAGEALIAQLAPLGDWTFSTPDEISPDLKRAAGPICRTYPPCRKEGQ